MHIQTLSRRPYDLRTTPDGPVLPSTIPANILVAIVNYRTGQLAIDAIASLEGEVRARGDVHVVVVDNGSADGSAAMIGAAIARRGYGDWCTLLPLADNGGFAAGNNAAVAWYRKLTGGLVPAYLWLLNPDTRAKPGAIAGLIDFMTANPGVGIAGSRCERADGRICRTGFRLHSPRTEFNAAIGFGPLTRLLGDCEVALPPSDTPQRAEWVSGASMMIRREAIERVGVMDQGFFLYFEETDYCARVANAGLEIWTVPASRVIHIGGQATGVTGDKPAHKRRPQYWFFSRARCLVRHRGLAATHLANLLWLVGRPIGRLLARLRGKRMQEPPRFWRDFLFTYYGPGGLMYRPDDLIAGRS